MKQCPICLQRYSDAVNFCAKDGGLLETMVEIKAVDAVSSLSTSSPVPLAMITEPLESLKVIDLKHNEPVESAAPVSEYVKPSSKKPILGYAVAVILAAACVVSAMAIYKQMMANDETKTHQEELQKSKAIQDKVLMDKAIADKAAKAQADAVFAAKLKADAEKSGTLVNPFEITKAEPNVISSSNVMLDAGDAAMLKSRSNVRHGLNGAVLCVLPANATIRILGVAGTTIDNNGTVMTWHNTDACGKIGTIAASQLVFLN